MSQQDRSAGWAAYYDKLRDRPPRKTVLAALDLFGPPAADALVTDLGCGDGRDVVEMVRRGWNVVAVDAEAAALQQLAARQMPDAERITPIAARLEEVPFPIGLKWVNSSFAMPLCEPARFGSVRLQRGSLRIRRGAFGFFNAEHADKSGAFVAPLRGLADI